jgi:hypothetical protein
MTTTECIAVLLQTNADLMAACERFVDLAFARGKPSVACALAARLCAFPGSS